MEYILKIGVDIVNILCLRCGAVFFYRRPVLLMSKSQLVPIGTIYNRALLFHYSELVG